VASLRPTEKGVWLLAQGLLAGLTSAPVMLQASSNDDKQFVVSYQVKERKEVTVVGCLLAYLVARLFACLLAWLLACLLIYLG
jgi:hypothetical protein